MMLCDVLYNKKQFLKAIRIAENGENMTTVVWKKFTVGYFRVKFVHGEIFFSLGVSNE